MGYAMIVFECITCGTPTTGNPHKVPSIRISRENGTVRLDENGTREPVCRNCAEIINANRVSEGLNPIPIQKDAYEAIPEEAL